MLSNEITSPKSLSLKYLKLKLNGSLSKGSLHLIPHFSQVSASLHSIRCVSSLISTCPAYPHLALGQNLTSLQLIKKCRSCSSSSSCNLSFNSFVCSIIGYFRICSTTRLRDGFLHASSSFVNGLEHVNVGSGI